MNRSLLIASFVTVGAVVWVLSGQVGDAGKPATPAPAAAAPEPEPMQVRVRVSRATAREEAVILQGRTGPSRSVELKAEIRGRVIGLPAARGARVSAGDVLVRFDPEDRAAIRAQARALRDQRKLEYDAASALNRRGHAADVQLAAARAQLDGAEAIVARADADFADLEIRAPFDGVLEKRDAELGDFLDVGKPAATLVDLDPLRVTGYATEKQLAGLRTGAVAGVRLLNGETLVGRITFVAATAETETRTFRVEVEADNPDHRLAGGLTAQIAMPLPSRPAHFLPASALTLADDGRIGVKVAEAGDVAVFRPVDILSMTSEGVWLDGLADGARVIVVGHEFVGDGARVRPVAAASPAPASPAPASPAPAPPAKTE